MEIDFLIRDLFNLSNTTVLACEGGIGLNNLAEKKAQITNFNEVRQSITLIGERAMLNKLAKIEIKALETNDKINLTIEEAQSGAWHLVVFE